MDERLIDFSIPDDVAKRAHQVFESGQGTTFF